MGAPESARLAARRVVGEDIVLELENGVVVMDGASRTVDPVAEEQVVFDFRMRKLLGIQGASVVAGVVAQENVPAYLRPGKILAENGASVAAALGLVADKEIVEDAGP